MPDELTVPQRVRYPFAQVPGANSLADVLDEWRRRGLEPVQLTEAETQQRITITHDPLKGELRWECTPNMDGLGAILFAGEATLLMPSILTADAAMSIAEYFTKGDGRIDLGTGEAMVVVAFRDGKLAIDWQPREAPIAAKKLLATALLCLLAQDAGLPMEKLLNLFRKDTP